MDVTNLCIPVGTKPANAGSTVIIPKDLIRARISLWRINDLSCHPLDKGPPQPFRFPILFLKIRLKCIINSQCIFFTYLIGQGVWKRPAIKSCNFLYSPKLIFERVYFIRQMYISTEKGHSKRNCIDFGWNRIMVNAFSDDQLFTSGR